QAGDQVATVGSDLLNDTDHAEGLVREGDQRQRQLVLVEPLVKLVHGMAKRQAHILEPFAIHPLRQGGQEVEVTGEIVNAHAEAPPTAGRSGLLSEPISLGSPMPSRRFGSALPTAATPGRLPGRHGLRCPATSRSDLLARSLWTSECSPWRGPCYSGRGS